MSIFSLRDATQRSVITGNVNVARQVAEQISLYVTAARRLGYKVESVYYDVVRKPTIQPNPMRFKSQRDPAALREATAASWMWWICDSTWR